MTNYFQLFLTNKQMSQHLLSLGSPRCWMSATKKGMKIIRCYLIFCRKGLYGIADGSSYVLEYRLGTLPRLSYGVRYNIALIGNIFHQLKNDFKTST